ncbi:hypothetical protein, partial [Phenylobacterium sp.]|uniref:hypothetical protein n=1 Tax=Phenylobacterium sp. TaxID=1871053 RepID=UPI0025D56782
TVKLLRVEREAAGSRIFGRNAPYVRDDGFGRACGPWLDPSGAACAAPNSASIHPRVLGR